MPHPMNIASQMTLHAATAVTNGLANHIVRVFADDLLGEGQRTGAIYTVVVKYFRTRC